MYRSTDLKQKEVINTPDGRRIGFVGDVELNFEEGTIVALIVPNGGKLFGFFGKESEIIVPWNRVTLIGEDVILVDLDERFIRKYFY